MLREHKWKEQLNPRGSRKDHGPDTWPIASFKWMAIQQGENGRSFPGRRTADSKRRGDSTWEVALGLTASAWNSNSSSRKSTGWCYLKSRSSSAVRKPGVHDIQKRRLLALFQVRKSLREWVIESILLIKHMQTFTTSFFTSRRWKIVTNLKISYWYPGHCGFLSQALVSGSGFTHFLSEW